MSRVSCFRCQEEFERKPRGPVAHYCPECRKDINVMKQRERDASYRDRAVAFRAALPEDVGIPSVEDLAKGLSSLDQGSYVCDRQPSGWLTPRGSDDGSSTYFTDLAGELDHRAQLAQGIVTPACKDNEGYAILASEAEHWWESHPHWNVGL